MASEDPDSNSAATNNLLTKIFKSELNPFELLSLMTITVILLSFLVTYQYYSQFGIDISSYLDPTEIIFLFSGLFSSLVTISGILIMMVLASVLATFLPIKVPSWLDTLIIFLIILVGGLLGVLIFNLRYSLKEGDWLLVGVLPIIVLIATAPKKRLTSTAKVIIICILAMAFFSFRSRLSYKEITERKKHSVEVDVRFADFSLRTSRDFFYIGTTRNFIFFWDDFSKRAMTYPTKDIRWISTKRVGPSSLDDAF